MLAQPPPNLDTIALTRASVPPESLVRISRYKTSEPYFGKSGGNRFDDPLGGFGVCYAGDSFMVAFAESILHDEIPTDGAFHLARDNVESRFVISFEGSALDAVDLTGAFLRRLGGTNELSSEVPYAMTQRWSRAMHEHPEHLDGLRYVSRHMNTGTAYALFERSHGKFRQCASIPIVEHPKFALALDQFQVNLY